MAEEKYANSKCFILSKNGYEEITYSELCYRRDTDETYKDKKFIAEYPAIRRIRNIPSRRK